MFNCKPITMTAAILVPCMLFTSCDLFNQKVDLKRAVLAEVSGNTTEAFSLYTDALMAVTPLLALPDVNKSKTMTPDAWKKEVEQYQYWLNSRETKVSEFYQQSFDGAIKYSKPLASSNRLLQMKTAKIDRGSFAVEWNKMFFAPAVKVNPDHATLQNAAFSGKMSFLRFSSRISYAYTINIFNPVSKRRVEAHLYPENCVTFMVTPGEHYFICKSTVTFESGQVWVSPFAVSSITIPGESSLITATVVTNVTRD